MHYIALRERVEKIPKEKESLPVTENQNQLIDKLIKLRPHIKTFPEYKHFQNNKTLVSASEFISAAVENNPAIIKEDSYLRYMATRPRVEKVEGAHGLFSYAGKELNLEEEVKKLEEFKGNVFSVIISLKREDAARLGFDNAKAWRDMLRAKADEIAARYGIPLKNFVWYGAFHNESYHPHVHMLFYSTSDDYKGFISKNGIDKLRHLLGTEIFKDDLHEIYDKQTSYRNEITKETRQRFSEIIKGIQNGDFINKKLLGKIEELSDKLKNCTGKKQYGYLPKSAKMLVDEIVDEIAKDEKIDAIYELWYKAKCSVLNTYTDNFPDRLPLSQEKELKAIRNALIYECNKLSQNTFANNISASKAENEVKAKKQATKKAALNLAKSIAGLFRSGFNHYAGEDEDYDIDKQLRREINAVKNGENTLSM